MPRRATGTVWRVDAHGRTVDDRSPEGVAWVGRISLPRKDDGTPGGRPYIEDINPNLTLKQASDYVAACARDARDGGGVYVGREQATAINRGETVQEWFGRWLEHRRGRGQTSVAADESRVRTHIVPALGADRALALVTPPLLRRFVEKLDALVRAGGHIDAGGKFRPFTWKTAKLVWGLVTKAFKDATTGKVSALRVLDSNPAIGVIGPDRGADKAKHFLRPSELFSFAACDSIPLFYRRAFVVCTYLYLRPGELAVLEWGDVDLAHQIVHVTKALNYETGAVKHVKTGDGDRYVPIEPALVPLLEEMKEEARGDDPPDATVRGVIFPGLPHDSRLTRVLHDEDERPGYLNRAGIDRSDLHANTPTNKRLRFRDCRSTGITWRCARSDSAEEIMEAAGHQHYDTTRGYVRKVNGIRHLLGTVFPSLPPSLLGTNRPNESSGADGDDDDRSEIKAETRSQPWDLNPRPAVYETAALPLS